MPGTNGHHNGSVTPPLPAALPAARARDDAKPLLVKVREDGTMDFGDQLTEPQERWLAAYLVCGLIHVADERTGVSRMTSWRWRTQDIHFGEAFRLVSAGLADLLHDEAVKRALAGPDDPASGRLLEQLLKMHHPAARAGPSMLVEGDIVHRKVLVLGTDAAGNPISPPV